MKLFQVGWSVDEESVEYLVRMTDQQFGEVERVLKSKYDRGHISEYWLNDAVVLTFQKMLQEI